MPSAHSSNSAPELAPIIVRIGEIFLKGKNRRHFIKLLVRNIRHQLADIEGAHVESLYLRPVVWYPPAQQALVLRRLSRVFGIAAMACATVVEQEEEAITNAAIAAAREIDPGTSFKVVTNRRDKSFPIGSMALSAQIGGRIIEATGLPVDVRNPNHIIHIEIGPQRSFIFSRWQEGPGGLPVGSGGTATLLLSGGIDSPVAGWSMMRRGCHINAVYFHSFPYTGEKTKDKVLRLAKELARYQGKLVVNVVHFTDVQKTLREHGRDDLAVLLYRRMMVRAAAKIARKEDSKALVTGENLGQVASQTLDNLGVIEDASQLPILRPLLCLDKVEIIRKAEQVGTYETSIEPYEDTCTLFVPKNPATKARVSDLVGSEAGLDTEAMATALADNAERIAVWR